MIRPTIAIGEGMQFVDDDHHEHGALERVVEYLQEVEALFERALDEIRRDKLRHSCGNSGQSALGEQKYSSGCPGRVENNE
ncbi:hypothetical protein [Novosphingobium sp. PhB57]|uniref:hypothetical protein n=1 Tax=Novosphingobium sp. PhB57 TaxID=2485107 RepID=UPI001404D921|nr:hypothetical protein [Novosphingobium sp. PhB57]